MDLEANSFNSNTAFKIPNLHHRSGIAQNTDIINLLINNIPHVIWVSEESGHKKFISPNVQKVLGYSPEDIYNGGSKFWFDNIHTDDRNRVIEAYHNLINNTGKFDIEYRIKKKDNSMLWIYDRAFTSYNEDGHMLAFGIFSDITEKKHFEEELHKLHKLESVGILAGGIAHDFNNLLGAILGNISVAKIYTKNDSRVNAFLSRAEEACDLAKDLSYRLLTFAKGGDPLRKVMDIRKLLAHSIQMSLTGSNIQAEFFINDDLFPVEIDEGQIKQVLNNLAMNAKDAMPEGGKITLRAENIYISGNQELPLKKGNYLKISFQDYGIGIPENIISRIFDPYFSTKGLGSKKGQGLGLTICHSIIKRHGGLMTVESRPGFGTTFYIFLPAISNWNANSDSRYSAISKNPKKRILIMDDDDNIRYTLEQMLLHLGYSVTGTSNSKAAVTEYRNAMAQDIPFDYVLLDLTIRGGSGGEKTMEELLRLDPNVKGIISSGYANDPVMKNFKEFNFVAAIAKPFKLEKLSDLMKALDKEHRS